MIAIATHPCGMQYITTIHIWTVKWVLHSLITEATWETNRVPSPSQSSAYLSNDHPLKLLRTFGKRSQVRATTRLRTTLDRLLHIVVAALGLAKYFNVSLILTISPGKEALSVIFEFIQSSNMQAIDSEMHDDWAMRVTILCEISSWLSHLLIRPQHKKNN